MMRIGVIDLGTNSVRFDIHEIGRQGRYECIHRGKIMVRLGENVFVDRRLDKVAARRTLKAFEHFKRQAMEFQVDRIVAFGTSALREASDTDQLLRCIYRSTQIRVNVIPGEEEARLIALGVLSNELPAKGYFALVDIGGGSTEINVCRNRKVIYSGSFSLGSARMQQVFLKRSPPAPRTQGNPGGIEQARRFIRSTLFPQMIEESWPTVDTIVGSSGTVKSLLRIAKKDTGKKVIEIEWLRELIRIMGEMNATELLQIPGIDPKRVDMILSGALILEGCMEAFRATHVLWTDYALRDGIIAETLPRMKPKLSVKLPRRAWGSNVRSLK